MREIKFRVWDKSLARFVGTGMGCHFLIDAHDGKIFNTVEEEYTREKYIRLQYTGLKDKNGVEIYEGYILTNDYYPLIDKGRQNYVAIVKWCFAGFRSVLQCGDSDKHGIATEISLPLDNGKNFTVLGNIYENPELLEVTDE